MSPTLVVFICLIASVASYPAEAEGKKDDAAEANADVDRDRRNVLVKIKEVPPFGEHKAQLIVGGFSSEESGERRKDKHDKQGGRSFTLTKQRETDDPNDKIERVKPSKGESGGKIDGGDYVDDAGSSSSAKRKGGKPNKANDDDGGSNGNLIHSEPRGGGDDYGSGRTHEAIPYEAYSTEDSYDNRHPSQGHDFNYDEYNYDGEVDGSQRPEISLFDLLASPSLVFIKTNPSPKSDLLLTRSSSFDDFTEDESADGDSDEEEYTSSSKVHKKRYGGGVLRSTKIEQTYGHKGVKVLHSQDIVTFQGPDTLNV